METEVLSLHYASKRERFFAIIIFSLMLISFIVHLCVFSNILYKNIVYGYEQTEISKSNGTNQSILKNNKNFDDLIDTILLPFFCVMAHLIWTIVPIVVLDRCCISNSTSIYRILLKLFICTCPSLICNELSILFICHPKLLINDLLIISIKWLIFIATIIICFWTGILSDINKWRGIHGGQIAPKQYSSLYLFDN
ncbi:unnamed protein product [Rotaria sp. Silwood1]|nr:unnamed protein product [Rotaria sp. Silwood1]CAF3794425.1 unnamed protein product [Rotaria sp. Silwood1]CAF3797244.1 unnamed protein product [Rotaria sp. Silwood1]CAF4932864.1 unnamed protein product [Rotaria sp. Silwood1]CAF5129694.1 unnamed protein product [Rotaria sp. Silwood1]